MDEEVKKEHKHEAHKQYMEHQEHKKQKSQESTTWIFGIVALVLAILFVTSLATKGFSGGSGATTTTSTGKSLSQDEVKTKTLTYLNSLLAGQGTTATVDSIKDVGDLYEMQINVGGKTYDSFARKDGTFLFPTGIDLTQPVQQAAAATPTNIPKTAKPKVELFVMAYCPYGTQSEKGILPAIRTLGNKVDFSVKFVDYSMHESFAPEVEENLREYCIQQTQPDVYLKYLACFLNASNAQGLDANSSACIQKTGVDVQAMNQCYTATDTQYNITSLMANKATWLNGQFPQFNVQKDLNQKYGVQGSPTLIINGVQSSAGRSPSSYLKAICDSFDTAPSECQTQLDSATPGPGFGYDSTSAATAAGCGV